MHGESHGVDGVAGQVARTPSSVHPSLGRIVWYPPHSYVADGHSSGSRTLTVIRSEELKPEAFVTVRINVTTSLQSQAEGAVNFVVGECALEKNPNPPCIDHV